jgi:hypothetical protein
MRIGRHSGDVGLLEHTAIGGPEGGGNASGGSGPFDEPVSLIVNVSFPAMLTLYVPRGASFFALNDALWFQLPVVLTLVWAGMLTPKMAGQAMANLPG